LKKIFDDHQLSAADKMFFPVIGFVFSRRDNQPGKVSANACEGILLQQQDQGCSAGLGKTPQGCDPSVDR
jgi:hypothetical protein